MYILGVEFVTFTAAGIVSMSSPVYRVIFWTLFVVIQGISKVKN